MMTTLGEICVPTKSFDPSRMPDVTFQYVDITAVDNQRKEIVGARSVIGKDAPSRARNLMREGDVIVATTRPNLNAVALVPPELDGQVCSTGFCVLRPSPVVDSQFLFFAAQTPAFVESLSELARGANYPAVSDKQILNQSVSLPDLLTQRRIAGRLKSQLTTVGDARLLAKDSLKSLSTLLDKTIAESFHGITPLSLGRDESPAPKGWKWHLLLDLARQESGHTPSRRCPEYWADGDIPWLALPDIRALDCRVATETGEKTNATGIANSSARLLPPETVALCRTASVGYVTIFGCEMATSQHFANYVCGPKLHPRFLMWLFRAARVFIKSNAIGSVLPDIYMNVIHRFRVCVPDIAEQKKVAVRLDEAFRIIQQLQSAHQAQLTALDKLPGAYLREAFGTLGAEST